MPSPAKARPRVALLIETSNGYGRDLLHGVHDWTRASQSWSIRFTEHPLRTALPAWLNHWEGDGIIARVDSDEIAQALRRKGLPVVDVSAERARSEFPRVSIDNRAVARLAAEHLLGKQLRHFAYCGDGESLWSNQRGLAFQAAIKAQGLRCEEFRTEPRAVRSWDAEVQALAKWLRQQPRPLGLFACFDGRAQFVLEACHAARLSVPEEVAVLGVDNDQLICDLCDPPLSSVLPNARRTGYEAASILTRLMNGKKPVAADSREIEPVRVVERRSTDALAVNDRHVGAALQYIRAHAQDGIGVKDILRAVPVSRTLLERKFVRVLGESPHRHIKRLKLERVRQLLAETDVPIARIADLTGFESPSYLSAAFKKETGVTPRSFRAKQRHIR
jgi:LacI family transcriptional regulator